MKLFEGKHWLKEQDAIEKLVFLEDESNLMMMYHEGMWIALHRLREALIRDADEKRIK